MLDEVNERAVIGGNRPPAYDLEVLTAHKNTAHEFLKVTKQWLDMDLIKTPEHAEQVTDQIDGLRKLWNKIDKARKAEKKPHDDAAQEVQDAFNPLLTKVKTAGDKLKPKLAAYASEQAKIEAKKKADAEEKARKAAEEAEAARKAAEESNDIDAQVEAEEQAKAAAAAQKAAAKKTTTNVKSASGAGRTMSLRKIKEVEITNANVLFMAIREEPEVQEALAKAATRIVRASGYDKGKPLPGIKVNEREVMA
ncbi:hypothetical protein [Sulfitobacter sp. R18_1]|uniref:hypothetical protein n=1 Tax=Sulfitobacter sp. R18_1 TaxID=2821104 RepID=UPI001ADC2C3A|nr:hypothetical protein [Sulfitobacter sp. R18_1]MBO9430579.1 hypothetical protein [Sulfitobacter sp. R18_1]